jgi:hypothetical protein
MTDGLDLTDEFNGVSSFFSWLFRLFTSGFSSPEQSNPSANETGAGDSFFTGIENFLKFIVSGFTSKPDSASSTPETSTVHTSATSTARTSATSTASTPATSGNPPKTFMGSVKDHFNAATNSVSKFFHGAAFNISKAIGTLQDDCRPKATGSCLAHVEQALTAGGLRYGGGKNIAQVMPVRYTADGTPTHWAKDLPQVLNKDPRFSKVATGYGAKFDASYTPQKGDIVAWTGGRFGHTQMCTGFVNGKPIWISDFKTNPNNWTGLANPDSHGEFKIFRQKPADDATLVASNQPTTPQPPRLNT